MNRIWMNVNRGTTAGAYKHCRMSDTLCQSIIGSGLWSSIVPPEQAVDRLLWKWNLTSAACARLSDAALCAFNRKWVLYLLTDKPLYPFKNVQRSDLSFIAEHLHMCGQPWC